MAIGLRKERCGLVQARVGEVCVAAAAAAVAAVAAAAAAAERIAAAAAGFQTTVGCATPE